LERTLKRKICGMNLFFRITKIINGMSIFWNDLYSQKGDTVKLNVTNLCFLRKHISIYEENTLEVKNDSIYINHVYSPDYIFKQNYYFMIGDNRHNSQDKPPLGLCAEDHIVW